MIIIPPPPTLIGCLTIRYGGPAALNGRSTSGPCYRPPEPAGAVSARRSRDWRATGPRPPRATLSPTQRHDPRGRGAAMRAVRLHAYKEPLSVDEVAEPEITGPFDVIVRVGGAGLCRTDLH